MHLQAKPLAPAYQKIVRYIIGILFLLAIVLRVSLYPIETSDYIVFLSRWYDFIQTHGGFSALKYNFSNYNPPYLYLFVIASYTPIPKLVAIKSISVLFDAMLAVFTYLILDRRYQHSLVPLIGALVVVFTPTVFINSSAWGQCDAIYTAFCLGSLYFLLKQRPAWACVCFALAISFKLQAIFFLPVLLLLLLKRQLTVKSLVLIPLIFLLMLVPAFIAGANMQELFSAYPGQVATGGVGGAGQFNASPPAPAVGRGPGRGQLNGGRPDQFKGRGPGQFRGTGPGPHNGRGNFSSSSLTFNAPSFYQWLSKNAPAYWKWVGILLAGAFVILMGALLLFSKQQLTPEIVLRIALVFAVVIPFLLPEMHERYFYMADVFSIAYAFYFPRLFYIALLQQLCSLASYAPYLLNRQVVSLAYVACAILVIAIITLADLIVTLYPRSRKTEHK
jgi:Gpi18-like mannosyltransferase